MATFALLRKLPDGAAVPADRRPKEAASTLR